MAFYTNGQSFPTLNAPLQQGGDQGYATPSNDAGVIRPNVPAGKGPGYDPSYLQNLATSIGGTFMRPSGGVLNFNPLGNLQDIQSNPLGGGSAPLFGLPQQLLQSAQNASIFPAAPAPITPAGQGMGQVTPTSDPWSDLGSTTNYLPLWNP